MKLPQNLIEKLKEPLPKEAVSPHPTKPYLSTIKVIFVVERLNEVFGLGGWKVKNEIIEKADVQTKNGIKQMVVAKSFLTIPEYEIEIESYGGNDNEDLGDAYKGACTDALSKIGSYLYIGMDVYKGLADKAKNTPVYRSNSPANAPQAPNASLTTPKTLEAQKKRIVTLLGELNMIDPLNYTKEDVELAVKQKTDEKLLPANYQEIINKLSILNQG